MTSYRGYSWEEFQMLPAPVGGWNPDVPPSELPENQAPVLDNFIVRAGEIVPRGSIQKTAAWATTPGNPMAYTGVQPVPGDTQLLAGQKTPGGTPAAGGVDPWTAPIVRPASAALATADTRYALQNIVGVGGTNATGTRDSAPGWRGVTFQGKRYYISYDSAGAAVQDPGATYFMRPLSLCQVDVAGTLTVLTLAPHGASDIKAYQSRIWLAGGIDTPAGGTTYDPTKIFYTIPGTTNALGSATADWRDPVSGATNFIKLDGNTADPLTGIATYRNTQLFFRYGSIYALRGTDSSNYIAQPVTREMGVFDPRSIVESDNGVFFLSRRGLMLTDGNVVRNVSGPVLRTLQQAVAIVLGSIRAGWGGSATCTIASQGQIVVSLSVPNITSSVLDGKLVPIWSAIYDPATGTWARLTSALWYAAASNNYYPGILMNTPDRRLLALDDTAIYQLESEAVVGLTTSSASNYGMVGVNDASLGINAPWVNANDGAAADGAYATVVPDSSGSSPTPRLAGAGADNASIGTVAWTNTGQITVENGSIATASAVPTFGGATHYLVSSAHGFALPTGSVVKGVQVDWKRDQIGGSIGTSYDNAIRLVKAGAIQSPDKSSGTAWTNSLTWITYGGATDLWGTAWTGADINAANFGAALSVQNVDTVNVGAYAVDAVRITVWYTSPTQYLNVNTFGFAIPTNASIKGIQLTRVGRDNTGSNNLKDASVRLSRGGVISGTDKATSTPWAASDATVTYGSPTDLWGLTWTPTDINASNFGVNTMVIAINPSPSPFAFVDSCLLSIYYQLAAATALQSFVQTPALYDQQDSTHWLAIPLLWVTRLAPAGEGRRMVQLKRFFLDFVMQANAAAVTSGWTATAVNGSQIAFGPTLTTPIGSTFVASSIVGAPNISAAGVQRQNQDEAFEATDLAFRIAFTDATVRSTSPDPIDARLYDIGVQLQKTRDTTG